MTPFSTEWQLLVLAACFYIYDSALLLYVNEGILTPTRRGWSIKTADAGYTIRGKSLVFPNLLLPHRPVYRLFWQYNNPEGSSSAAWDEEKSLYRHFIPMVYGMAAALFFALPIVLFLNRTDFALLSCLTIIYLNSFLTGFAIFFSQKRLQLSRNECWSIIFECLLCPPLTINVVRKMSTRRIVSTSLVAAGAALLEATHKEILFKELLSQINNEIEAATDHEKSILMTARCELIKLKNQCH